MQYGVLSDIHGHRAALASVWAEFAGLGLTSQMILNAGDNVGYGDAPESCVQFLRAHSNIVTTQGNYDKNVALFPDREAEYRKKWARARPEKYEALRRDSAVISDETRVWLLDLPKEIEMVLSGVPVLVTHYAPGRKTGLGRWTSDSELEELAAGTQAKVVVCGHTHTPFVRRVGGILWLNPGTVGRSFFGGPRYAVLTLEPGQPPDAHLGQAGKP